MQTKRKDLVCPQCGKQLVYEIFGQYGNVHKINPNGTIQKTFTRMDYGSDEMVSDMIYCRDCGWTAFNNFEVQNNRVISLGGEANE